MNSLRRDPVTLLHCLVAWKLSLRSISGMPEEVGEQAQVCLSLDLLQDHP